MPHGKKPHSEQQAPMQGLRRAGPSGYSAVMKHRPRRAIILILLAASLSACGMIDRIKGRDAGARMSATPDPAPVAEGPVADGPVAVIAPLGGAQTAAALDQTTQAEKAAAMATPQAAFGRDLGRVVVALGSPAEQGFWLRSALVTAPGKGRAVTASGASVNVDLQPGTGAALMSLAAFRALNLGLTDLPEVQVFAN